MNLALLDLAEVQAPLPEVIEDKLVAPDEVVLCAFNRRGNLLAGGCSNGAVVIWDFDTHGIAQTLVSGAGGRVTSISWTRSSRRLLSSSADGALILWDVLHGEKTQRLDLGGEIGHAALHPRSRSLCVACVGTGAACQAFLINLQQGAEQRIPLVPPSLAGAQDAAAAAGGEGEGGEGAPSKKAASVSYACFSSDGATILVGTSRGAVHFLSTATREELFHVQLPGVCRQPRPARKTCSPAPRTSASSSAYLARPRH
jgi:COMPASS component SWD1